MGSFFHEISDGIDKGNVWCQKEIKYDKFSSQLAFTKKEKLKSSNYLIKIFLKY